MTDSICTGPDCTRPSRGRGALCNAHRQQLANLGRLQLLGRHCRKTVPAVDVARDLDLVALPDLPGYGIHRNGQVWAVGTNWRSMGARPLTTPLDGHGYHYVRMNIGDRRMRQPVHKLVCRAFYGEPLPGQQARHLNGDKTDNCAANLAWGTAKENADDREAHGTTARGPRIHQSKLTDAQVVAIRERRAAGEVQRALADEYGVSQATVSQIVLRKWWKHL